MLHFGPTSPPYCMHICLAPLAMIHWIGSSRNTISKSFRSLQVQKSPVQRLEMFPSCPRRIRGVLQRSQSQSLGQNAPTLSIPTFTPDPAPENFVSILVYLQLYPGAQPQPSSLPNGRSKIHPNRLSNRLSISRIGPPKSLPKRVISPSIYGEGLQESGFRWL